MLLGLCCTLSQIPPGNIFWDTVDIKQGDSTIVGFFRSSEGRLASLFYLLKYQCVNLFVEYDRKFYDLCQALHEIL